MGRTAGRSASETRSALLDGAAEAIRVSGPSASLDDIARHAGITKSGLIYHFSSKDELILELTHRLLANFDDAIEAAIEPDDDQPGRVTRGYIRAVLAPEPNQLTARDTVALLVQLMSIPAIDAVAQADAMRIDARLREDGLPDDVLTLVSSAVDGAQSSRLWGGPVRTESHAELERRLIYLTRHPELWSDIAWN